MFTFFYIVQLVVTLESYVFVMPATLLIAFAEIKKFVGFKYFNINWFLGKIKPGLSLKTLFMSSFERFKN